MSLFLVKNKIQAFVQTFNSEASWLQRSCQAPSDWVHQTTTSDSSFTRYLTAVNQSCMFRLLLLRKNSCLASLWTMPDVSPWIISWAVSSLFQTQPYFKLLNITSLISVSQKTDKCVFPVTRMWPRFTGQWSECLSDVSVCHLKKKTVIKIKPRQICIYLRFCPGMWDSTPHFSIWHAAAQAALFGPKLWIPLIVLYKNCTFVMNVTEVLWISLVGMQLL